MAALVTYSAQIKHSLDQAGQLIFSGKYLRWTRATELLVPVHHARNLPKSILFYVLCIGGWMGYGESAFELRKFEFPILCALNTGFAGTKQAVEKLKNNGAYKTILCIV